MIDKTDQTRRDLIEAVHLMRHEHGSLWSPVYECGCESWVDVMLGNYDDIVNERESTAQPAPDPLRGAALAVADHAGGYHIDTDCDDSLNGHLIDLRAALEAKP